VIGEKNIEINELKDTIMKLKEDLALGQSSSSSKMSELQQV